MAKMKTPGIYIVENDIFGNDVVEVATAIPAFIGYTEKADNGGKPLRNKPTRITSIEEYMQFFGGAPRYQYSLSETAAVAEAPEGAQKPATPDFIEKEKGYVLKQTGEKYNLFNSLRFFFQNGGNTCYIVSVGNYNDPLDITRLMDNGIPPLLKTDAPTMVVVPEAIHLKEDDCIALQQAVLKHCETMQSRIGILDIYDGYKARKHPDGDVIDNFRNALGENSLSYGIAYYPWLYTTIVGDSELGIANLTNESLTVLKNLIMAELNVPAATVPNEPVRTSELRAFLANICSINDGTYIGPAIQELTQTLAGMSVTYNNILAEMKEQLNVLAPGAAMAGVYTLVDATRGVWKAPANVSLNAVYRPAVNISNAEQEDLSNNLHGKPVNAIRSFAGEGVLVWGAHTLDGNSQDWRYVNVRRTMIMLEQSIKAAIKSYVSEPNNANTWTTIKSRIERFLNSQWKAGALAGSSPDDAYSVNIGLGSTMTADDILEGKLRITVLVAISRPAKFIGLTFQQQMQKS